MSSPFQAGSTNPQNLPPQIVRSRYRNRLWMILVVAIALVFLGVIIWNRFTAPNAIPDPVEQGTMQEQQQAR